MRNSIFFREMQFIKIEMQDNKLKIKRLENNPNEKTTSSYRAKRENHNDKSRDENIHMPRDDDDEIR